MRLAIRGDRGPEYVAEVSDDLRDQAEVLLRQLAERGPEVAADGSRVRLDWGIVRLSRHGDEVRVEEPDYRRAPLRFVPGLDVTCAVLRSQQRVHDRLGVGAEPVTYDQFLLAYPGGLTAPAVAAIRQASMQPAESGWRLFDAGRIDWTAEPRARRLYEVAGERPSLLAVLSLPVGWSVRIEGEVLAEAARPGGGRIAVGMAVGL